VLAIVAKTHDIGGCTHISFHWYTPFCWPLELVLVNYWFKIDNVSIVSARQCQSTKSNVYFRGFSEIKIRW